MRNRASTLVWSLFGVGLGVGSLVGCAPEEREFGESNDSDGGHHVVDRPDASVSDNDGGKDTDSDDEQTQVVIVETSDETSNGSVATGETAGNTSDAPTDVTANTDDTPTTGPVDTSGGVTGNPGSTSDVTDVTEPGNTSDVASTSNVGDTSSTSTQDTSGAETGNECVPTGVAEGNCTDHVDDDCDGYFDCDDTEDCSTSLDCFVGCAPIGDSELTCNDYVDDDCDGFRDCEDVDCVNADNCKQDCEPTPEECGDSLDNDCDGFADCLDSQCAATAACCTSSGSEVCNDGIDNDCDGVIDCPILIDANPKPPPEARAGWEGGAVAASQATLYLEQPARSEYKVQCRSGKPADVSTKQFIVCNPMDPGSTELKPLSGPNSNDPEFNGLTTTQVRFAYPNGQASQLMSYSYYVHNSLVGAQPCADVTTDQAYFDFALNYLGSDSLSFTNEEARLAAPFVNIHFTPRLGTIFDVNDGDGDVEYLSLRRRFVLSPDNQLILMKRVYGSRRMGPDDCLAGTIRKHATDLGPTGNYDKNRDFKNSCNAIVMNKEGAGLCLQVDIYGNITVPNPQSSQWSLWIFYNHQWVNWEYADNFMWRKLLGVQHDSSQVTFSPKCYAGGPSCVGSNSNMLFLPDRNLLVP